MELPEWRVWLKSHPLDAAPRAAEMNRHIIRPSRRVGEPSSKYGYQPEPFEQDLEHRQQESEELWREFRAWMVEHQADPEKLRYLFLWLWEEFLG